MSIFCIVPNWIFGTLESGTSSPAMACCTRRISLFLSMRKLWIRLRYKINHAFLSAPGTTAISDDMPECWDGPQGSLLP